MRQLESLPKSLQLQISGTLKSASSSALNGNDIQQLPCQILLDLESGNAPELPED